mgnify:CR=1 FL=1
MKVTKAKRPSSAFTTVDFDRTGRQIGHIMFPHSPNDDAWGVTRVPVAVVANGKGPTVIMEGGNHGDEYEGPIVIGELARDLDPAELQGRLILMPSNNIHAVMGAQRTSTVDGLNFNRTFPGDPLGTITQQISAYMTDHIFPMGDAFLDLHSGGSSVVFLTSAGWSVGLIVGLCTDSRGRPPVRRSRNVSPTRKMRSFRWVEFSWVIVPGGSAGHVRLDS